MDLLHLNRDEIDIFCIVSGDGDFISLAHRIRKAGLEVICAGRENSSSALQNACNYFINLSKLHSDDNSNINQPENNHNFTKKALIIRMMKTLESALLKTFKQDLVKLGYENILENKLNNNPQILPEKIVNSDNNQKNLKKINPNLIRSAFDKSKDKTGGASLGLFNKELVKLGFSYKNHRFSTFKKFCESLTDYQIYNKEGTKQLAIKHKNLK